MLTRRRVLAGLLGGLLTPLRVWAQPAPPSNLRVNPMAILASDAFNRADETPLASPWTQTFNTTRQFLLSANTAIAEGVNLDCWMFMTGVTWPADQYAQGKVTVAGTSAGTGRGVLVRAQNITTAKTYYRVVVSKAVSNNVELVQFVAGAWSVLAQRTTTWVDGDVLRLEVTGSGATVTLKIFQNGSQLGADVSDSSADRITAAGNAGLGGSSTFTSGNVDDWEAGDFAAVAASVVTPRSFALLGVGA